MAQNDDYAYGTSIKLFEREIWAGENDEPSRFVHEWQGHIVFEPPHSERRKVIGSFAFHFVDLASALNAKVSYFDVFDTHQSTFDVFQTLYDADTHELRDDVSRLLYGTDYQFQEGVLILDRLEVLPKHRKHNVGLRVMKAIIESFGAAAGFVVLKAFPLQFEGDDGPTAVKESSLARAKLALQEFTRSERVARSKLKRYYGRLGFIPVPRTEYMVWTRCVV